MSLIIILILGIGLLAGAGFAFSMMGGKDKK